MMIQNLNKIYITKHQNRHIGGTHHAELVAHDADGGVVGELEIVDARHHRRKVLVGVHVRRVEGLQGNDIQNST